MSPAWAFLGIIAHLVIGNLFIYFLIIKLNVNISAQPTEPPKHTSDVTTFPVTGAAATIFSNPDRVRANYGAEWWWNTEE